MKRSDVVILAVIGSAYAATLFGHEDIYRDQYRSREDCARDWGRDARDCQPEGGAGGSFGYWHGPRYEDGARRCEDVGFAFHSDDGVYWDESAAYEFDAAQVDRLEAVTEELHQLALQAVDWIVEGERFHPFGLGPTAIEEIVRSWRRRDPSLFVRFDLSWDGIGEPKLLKYNADTPTSPLESSVVQWFWLQDTLLSADQFNSLHEEADRALAGVARRLGARAPPTHARLS